MKYLNAIIIVSLFVLLGGCSSKSIVLRDAPEEGVSVQGINVLYRMVPLTHDGSSVAKEPSSITEPHPQMERLGQEISERMISELQNKGVKSNFASIDIMPGIKQTAMNELFPKNSTDMYTLTITPIRKHVFCYQTCVTTFTVSLSLRTPKENREVWNAMLKQSRMSASDVMPFKNYQFISDMTEAVLSVVGHS